MSLEADDTAPAPARAELVAIDGGYEILVTDAETGAVTRRRIGILSVALLAEQSARALATHARALARSGG